MLLRYVADGRLSPKIGVVADWGRLPEVLAELAAHRVPGKAVLTIG